MRLSDNFKLSYGVRVDVPVWEDGLANADFNNRTIPLLQGKKTCKVLLELSIQLLILHHV
jgi:hypothetical protein